MRPVVHPWSWLRQSPRSSISNDAYAKTSDCGEIFFHILVVARLSELVLPETLAFAHDNWVRPFLANRPYKVGEISKFGHK
jgi:hypothetical protein